MLSFLAELARIDSGLYFAALLNVCELGSTPALVRKLLRLRSRLKSHADLDLRLAEILFSVGQSRSAGFVCKTLKQLPVDGHQSTHRFGLTDISYIVRLTRLQYRLGLESGAFPEVTNEDREALARIERVARELGVLIGMAEQGEIPCDLKERFRALLLFHNRPVSLRRYGVHSGYRISQSRSDIYRRITETAKGFGSQGTISLREVVEEIFDGPAADQFTPPQRRLFAKFSLRRESVRF